MAISVLREPSKPLSPGRFPLRTICSALWHHDQSGYPADVSRARENGLGLLQPARGEQLQGLASLGGPVPPAVRFGGLASLRPRWWGRLPPAGGMWRPQKGVPCAAWAGIRAGMTKCRSKNASLPLACFLGAARPTERREPGMDESR